MVLCDLGAYILVLIGLRQTHPTGSFSYNLYTNAYVNGTYIAANLVTGCVQLLATLLIAYKAWYALPSIANRLLSSLHRVYWRDVRKFSDQHQLQHSVAMLAVIIESGSVYLALLASHRSCASRLTFELCNPSRYGTVSLTLPASPAHCC